ncbi:MAG: L-ribulose-5-phosphate 3-epimerase [Tissierellia bacterium]|nr:L-ribulose-5-phosphate 3-epimerase [Tissierellia bacterium]
MDNRYSLGIYEKAMPNSLSIDEKLELAKITGFDRLEISIDETDEKLERLYDDSGREISKYVKKINIPIKTMCLSGHRKYPLGSHDPEIRKKSLEILNLALEFSDRVGIRIIQLAGYDVYYEDGDADTVNYFQENLNIITERAAKYGIILAFETMETEFMDTIAKSMNYVNKIGSPYLGIYPDIGNLMNAYVKYDIEPISDLINGEGKIFAAHLKETKPGIYRNMDFGTGHTDYDLFIKELIRQKVRIFTGEFWHLGEEDYTDKIKKASIFLRDKIEKWL